MLEDASLRAMGVARTSINECPLYSLGLPGARVSLAATAMCQVQTHAAQKELSWKIPK
jgi:hypothetical protein